MVDTPRGLRMGVDRARLTLDEPVLTRKERQLLGLLENNPGRCYSRSYLLKTIWGYSNDTRTRTVDVHVSRLRKKLRSRTDILIHTVVRQGYVLQRSGASSNASPPGASLPAGVGRTNATV